MCRTGNQKSNITYLFTSFHNYQYNALILLERGNKRRVIYKPVMDILICKCSGLSTLEDSRK